MTSGDMGAKAVAKNARRQQFEFLGLEHAGNF